MSITGQSFQQIVPHEMVTGGNGSLPRTEGMPPLASAGRIGPSYRLLFPLRAYRATRRLDPKPYAVNRQTSLDPVGTGRTMIQ